MTAKFLIGLDGGGTKTRGILLDQNHKELTRANGPASALNQGIDHAVIAINQTIDQLFLDAKISRPTDNEIAVGIGISGANNDEWKKKLTQALNNFARLVIDTDGYTTHLGAFEGRPGLILALGTGSVGLLVDKSNSRLDVSGWGFPAGDEASGAWFGLKAISLTQQMIDGRVKISPLTEKVFEHFQNKKENLMNWTARAQATDFATLAPFILETYAFDKNSRSLVLEALSETEKMILALNKNLEYDICITGSIGTLLAPHMPFHIRQKAIAAFDSSEYGAYLMIKANP